MGRFPEKRKIKRIRLFKQEAGGREGRLSELFVALNAKSTSLFTAVRIQKGNTA